MYDVDISRDVDVDMKWRYERCRCDGSTWYIGRWMYDAYISMTYLHHVSTSGRYIYIMITVSMCHHTSIYLHLSTYVHTYLHHDHSLDVSSHMDISTSIYICTCISPMITVSMCHHTYLHLSHIYVCTYDVWWHIETVIMCVWSHIETYIPETCRYKLHVYISKDREIAEESVAKVSSTLFWLSRNRRWQIPEERFQKRDSRREIPADFFFHVDICCTYEYQTI